MGTKDWILLLVPIFCNGVILFILQKTFEKKQIIRTIKFEYASHLRQKIDLSIELHAKATRIVNEGESENSENVKILSETLAQYFHNTLDIYYYYVQNEIVFKRFEKQMKLISVLLVELSKIPHQKEFDLVQFCALSNKIRDELMVVKNDCINLRF